MVGCGKGVTGASNWYWLTVGKGLLSLQQLRVQGDFFISLFLYFHSFSFFSPVPLLHLLYYFFSLFSVSLEDDIKWPTVVDVSLNPNTISQSKYWDTLTSYHTGPNIWTNPFYYTLMCLTLHACWVYSLKSFRWGESNEYAQHTVTWQNKKNISLTILDWLQSFLPFLSFFITSLAVFVSLIPFHCFTIH